MSKTKANPPRARSITDIIYVVAEFYGVPPSDIYARRRTKTLAEARAVVYSLCRDLTRASLPEIGDALGKEHSTVMRMVQRTSERCKRDEWLAKAVAVCRARAIEAIAARRCA